MIKKTLAKSVGIRRGLLQSPPARSGRLQPSHTGSSRLFGHPRLPHNPVGFARFLLIILDSVPPNSSSFTQVPAASSGFPQTPGPLQDVADSLGFIWFPPDSFWISLRSHFFNLFCSFVSILADSFRFLQTPPGSYGFFWILSDFRSFGFCKNPPASRANVLKLPEFPPVPRCIHQDLLKVLRVIWAPLGSSSTSCSSRPPAELRERVSQRSHLGCCCCTPYRTF